MTKKGMLFGVIVFILGFILGGLSIVIYFGQHARNTGEISGLHFRVYLERRALQAYSEENPKVAIWELENLIKFLNENLGATKSDKIIIQQELVLTYTRLAIVSKATKDEQKYKDNISKALAVSMQAYPSLKTEEELLEFVKKVDSIGNKEKETS